MVLGRRCSTTRRRCCALRPQGVERLDQPGTLGAGVGDSLCSFRVCPVAGLAAVMQGQPWMRRFDFDTEAVVRLAWRGVKPVNVDAPVKYSAPTKAASHFRYGRDNAAAHVDARG